MPDRHAKARWTAVIVSIALFIAACGGGSKVRRTQTDRWKVRTFSKVGMRMDIPRGAELDSHPSFGLSVRLHAVRPRGFRVAETQYLVTVKVERMPLSTFSEELDSLRRNVPRTPEKEWIYWTEERHEKISVFDHGEYAHYRYDAKCAGDEVLRVDVGAQHLISDGVLKHKAEDDRMVRRMLASLQCFEPTAPRVSRE